MSAMTASVAVCVPAAVLRVRLLCRMDGRCGGGGVCSVRHASTDAPSAPSTGGKSHRNKGGTTIHRVNRASVAFFPAFPYSFRRSMGRSPSLRAPESHFNEFTSGCTRFFNRLKISNLQIILHICPISKEGGCAVRFVTIWFTMMFFFPVHHEVNSLKAGRNENV